MFVSLYCTIHSAPMNYYKLQTIDWVSMDRYPTAQKINLCQKKDFQIHRKSIDHTQLHGQWAWKFKSVLRGRRRGSGGRGGVGGGDLSFLREVCVCAREILSRMAHSVQISWNQMIHFEYERYNVKAGLLSPCLSHAHKHTFFFTHTLSLSLSLSLSPSHKWRQTRQSAVSSWSAAAMVRWFGCQPPSVSASSFIYDSPRWLLLLLAGREKRLMIVWRSMIHERTHCRTHLLWLRDAVLIAILIQ